jgi:hypothetical protein
MLPDQPNQNPDATKPMPLIEAIPFALKSLAGQRKDHMEKANSLAAAMKVLQACQAENIGLRCDLEVMMLEFGEVNDTLRAKHQEAVLAKLNLKLVDVHESEPTNA